MTRDEYLKSKRCIYCGDELVLSVEIAHIKEQLALAQESDRSFLRQHVERDLGQLMNRRVCMSCAASIVTKIDTIKTLCRTGHEDELKCIRCGKCVGSRKNLNDQFICKDCEAEIKWINAEDTRNFLEYCATKKTETKKTKIITITDVALDLIDRQPEFRNKPVIKDFSPRRYSERIDDEGKTWKVEMRGHRGY